MFVFASTSSIGSLATCEEGERDLIEHGFFKVQEADTSWPLAQVIMML